MDADALQRYRATPVAAGRTPWREARFVVVDLETTGLDARRDEIVSFAAVPVLEGRAIPGLSTSLLVRPEHGSGPAATRIHGLRSADLASAPPLALALHAIATALTGSVLVAHAAWIERAFLDAALRTAGARLRGPVIDTLALGRRVLTMRGAAVPEHIALGRLARTLGLPVHRPHHADGDALTAAQVFLALATALEADRRSSVSQLVAVSRRSGCARRWAVRPPRRGG